MFNFFELKYTCLYFHHKSVPKYIQHFSIQINYSFNRKLKMPMIKLQTIIALLMLLQIANV